MRLENITVNLRPRQPWEAVDLGCAMVRRDYGRIILLWACTVLPLWVLVCMLLHAAPVWIPLVVWWLKPLYDRVPLFFLSRAAFGERPGFAETMKQWPRLWLKNCLPALLWRRLSFIRSFALPAQMLEGLSGGAANQRIKTLAMDGGGSGLSLSYVFSKIELAAWIGLMAGTYDLLPEAAQPEWSGLSAALDIESSIPRAFLWWGAACHMLIVTLIEPFYVGAGFALYLNCRTRIEGWDVELAFRRMAARLTSGSAALVIALLALMAASSPLHAADPKLAQADTNPELRKMLGELEGNIKKARLGSEVKSDPAKTVEKVLKEPEFEIHKIKSKKWVPDFKSEKKSSAEMPSLGFLEIIGKGLFWLLLIGLTSWLVYYLVRNRHLFISRSASRAPVRAPKVLMGMNITRESLPDDIVAAARAAWATGDGKEALSLLYRGSLSWLVNRRRVPISDSDTEEDCLMQVIQAGEKPEAEYFRQLTGAWVQVAYALLPVSDAEMGALCDQWPFIEKGGAA
ncbi:DUF4129 domain-containing protein [Prosthecobacter vanneervenii]|uniref:Protein-glutamine gamma-glutamyltransferase-like C-terminal domain-containing protein n=1 Tax=Prosthecobacter vanneervenii TaxID=48466 RepID=A0A7W7YC81_9BACT|nr:DUF4129 domain-containing protein [Prosthecobacter vanneervenii]MBB5033526.1 hypothetical protein [Prosthecobacter vanneervenii]